MIYEWSVQAFGFVNAMPAHPAVLMLAKIVSSWPVILVFTALAALLVVRHQRSRGPLALALAAVVLAMAANIAIGMAMPMDRPFVMGIGQKLVEHAPTPSFPSNHATFLFALGLGLIWTRASSWLGWLALVFAALTAWSRLYLGVHFPIDIMGSLAAAALAAALCGALASAVRRRVHRTPGVGTDEGGASSGP